MKICENTHSPFNTQFDQFSFDFFFVSHWNEMIESLNPCCVFFTPCCFCRLCLLFSPFLFYFIFLFFIFFLTSMKGFRSWLGKDGNKGNEWLIVHSECKIDVQLRVMSGKCLSMCANVFFFIESENSQFIFTFMLHAQ